MGEKAPDSWILFEEPVRWMKVTPDGYLRSQESVCSCGSRFW